MDRPRVCDPLQLLDTMRTRLSAAAIILMLAATASCKKDPPTPDPIADLSKRLKNSPKADLQKFEDLARTLEDLAKNNGASGVATSVDSLSSANRASDALPPITTMTQFDAFLQKAGYATHAEVGDYPAYFVSMDKASASAIGLPDELRVFYRVKDPAYLIYVAVVRYFRDDEESIDEVANQTPSPKKTELLKHLDSRLNDKHMRFTSLNVPIDASTGTGVYRGALVLGVVVPNPNGNPQLARLAVDKINAAVEQTRDVWR